MLPIEQLPRLWMMRAFRCTLLRALGARFSGAIGSEKDANGARHMQTDFAVTRIGRHVPKLAVMNLTFAKIEELARHRSRVIRSKITFGNSAIEIAGKLFQALLRTGSIECAPQFGKSPGLGSDQPVGRDFFVREQQSDQALP